MIEQEHKRAVKHRLAIIRHVEEVTHDVSKTCRYYGISRQSYYKWYRRYEKDGEAGLREHSRGLKICPIATPAEVIDKIIYLRSNYRFGASKISMYLKHYHDVAISNSGVWRILKRLEMNRLPRSQRYKRREARWKRYEKALPGHQVQIDVKFITPPADSKKRYYQFTAIDDCTRFCILKVYERLNQHSAIQFVDFAVERLPCRVAVIQTDIQTGSEFQSQFHWHVLDKGVVISTSGAILRASMSRWRDHTRSTTRSSINCSKESLSTTQRCSNTRSKSGRTSTTTFVHKVGLKDRLPMRDCSRKTIKVDPGVSSQLLSHSYANSAI